MPETAGVTDPIAVTFQVMEVLVAGQQIASQVKLSQSHEPLQASHAAHCITLQKKRAFKNLLRQTTLSKAVALDDAAPTILGASVKAAEWPFSCQVHGIVGSVHTRMRCYKQGVKTWKLTSTD